MKLEVGQYVRTKFGISKIIEEGNVKVIKSDNEETFDVDKNGRQYPTQFRDYIWTSDVIKTSHNIIDLIEAGDYVNGNFVWKDINGIHFKKGTMWVGDLEQGDYLNKTKIETIVTREQFEAMQYKVMN